MSKYATTPQVKRAKDALKDAGVGRFDARVRVETRRLKGGGREYGDAKVTLLLSTRDSLDRVPALLEAGFDVTVHHSGRTAYVHVDRHNHDRAGRLEVSPDPTPATGRLVWYRGERAQRRVNRLEQVYRARRQRWSEGVSA